jgi:hypothetical protein
MRRERNSKNKFARCHMRDAVACSAPSPLPPPVQGHIMECDGAWLCVKEMWQSDRQEQACALTDAKN